MNPSRSIYYSRLWALLPVLAWVLLTPRADAAVPTVVTNAVGSISNDSAVLNGTVNPNGASTDTFFEYSAQASLSKPEVVTTLAGNATAGFMDATGATAQFSTPTGVAMDSAGNVYVADSANNRIRKVTPDGTVSTFAGTGAAVPLLNGSAGAATFNTPTGVAVDASGDVYVADKGNNRIRKISGGVVSTLAGSGTPGSLDNINGSLAQFSAPTGLAVDGSGNVYVADSGNHRIRKVTSAGAVTTLAGSSAGFFDATGTQAHFTAPYGVALDASGSHLYVADTYNYRIRVVTTGGATPGVVTTLAGNSGPGNFDGQGAAAMFNWPTGVAVDSAGLLYVADSGNHRIRSVTSSGVVTTVAGNHLGFNDGTGTSALFSTPTALVVDAANHVLIADRDNQRIRVFGFATLAAQTGLTGSSDQSISASITGLTHSATYSYRAAATNSSGRVYASSSSFLAIGSDAGLSSLTLSSGTLSPTFASGTTAYGATVGNAVTQIQVTAAVSDAKASMTIGRNIVASGDSASIPLNVGDNIIAVMVTAENGVTSKTYTVTVNRAGSSNAGLSALMLSSGTLSPSFDVGTLGYAASVLNGTGSITVTPTVADATASVKVNGVLVSSGSASSGIPLNVGDNVLTLVVTAQDGVTTRTYVVTVKRAPSSNADLSALMLSSGTLSPSFDASTLSYAASVFNGTTSITVTPTVADATASVKVNDVLVSSGSASSGIPLNLGDNVLTLVVTAQDGVTTRTYTVTVNRSVTFDISLSMLTLSSGSPSPAFSNAVTYYTASVPYSVASFTVTPTSTDSTVSLTVNDVPLASGAASQTIALIPGINTLSVVVSKNGSGSQIYTIVVVRAFATPTVVGTVAATNLAGGAVSLHGTVNPSSSTTDSSFIYSSSPTLQPEMATLAGITEPVYLTADSLGNVYVGDGGLLRKITPQGAVSVLAGGGTSGLADGTGTEAAFDFIFGITTDGADNLYAEDSGHTKIRKITPAGVVTTLPDIAPYTSFGLAADTEGNLYFMDGPRIVRRSINGTFHVLSGGTTPGYVDAQGDAAKFGSAEALAVDLLGNVYMADNYNNAVRKITPDGVVTTLAGGGTWGYVDDIGSAARFNGPKDLTVDDRGNVYVLDKLNFRIRKVTPDGVVTTIAGSGVAGNIDGTGTAAAFHSSFGLAGRLNGDLYLADTGSYSIRSILSQRLGAQTGLVGNTAQDISASLSGLVVGNTYYYSASATNSGGRADGGILSFTVLSSDASLSGLEISSGTLSPAFASNTGLYSVTVSNAVTNITVTPTVAESNATVTVNGNAVASGSASASIALNSGNNTIPVVITAQDGVTTYTYTLAVLRDPLPPVATTTAASDISDSSATLHGNVISNGPDASASFEYSTSPTFDPLVVSTLAGSNPGYADGTGTAAQFSVISDVVVDATGNLYALDFFNQRIRKVTASGVVSTFVGSGAVGLDDGTGTAATLSYPSDLTMDGAGNLYLVDGEDTIIRKVTPNGVVSTLTAPTDYTIHALTADTVGNLYFIAFIAETANLMKRTPDGTISLLAANTLALSLAVDASGYLYTSVVQDYSVIKISPDGLTISTLAGGTEGAADGTGAAAQFEEAQVLDVDAAGNVYVNDAVFGGRYRKITPAGVVTTLTAGPDESGYVDGIGAVARFDTPNAAAVDAGGNLYVADTQNSRIRKISPLSVVTASGLTGNTELAVSASLTGLTPGVTYYYRTVAISADGISYGAAQSFTTLGPTVVETWLAAHFTSAERLDSQISGWTASPDNDGVNNLLEFAFGTDPHVAGSGPGKVIYAGGAISQRGQPVVRTANSTDFYADFARRSDYAAAGLTYTLQFSANLTTWEDSTATPSVVASDSEMEVVTVPFPALLGSGLIPRFFRVLVDLP